MRRRSDELKLTRRSLLQGAGLLTGGVMVERLLPGQMPATPAPCRVDAPCGPLEGTKANGVRRFVGVPFAQPPVGPLRFRAPLPMARWTAVRQAVEFAPAAMQPEARYWKQSEDCLYLNLWTPERVAKPLPVLVWIHGGGFTGGASFEPMSDGTEFAGEGVIVVTIAYRLGAFGFLDVSPMLGASYAGSANNGLRDIIAALRWVKENIGAFGGDANRVTIGGESAGAKLTDLLMGIPEARPLFQQMISESGGAERIFSRETSLLVAGHFAERWEKGRTREELATAPAEEIIATQVEFFREEPVHFPMRAQIDGVLIKRAPIEAIVAGSSKGKRLLLGTNREESASFLGPHPKTAPTAANLGNMPIEAFRPMEAEYARVYPEMAEDDRRVRSVTAEEYWIPSLRVAEAHVRGAGAAYVYLFTLPGAEGRLKGYAFHGAEMRFVWDRVTKKTSPDEVALAGEMHQAWLAFVKGESPSAPGLPAWPKYDLTHRPTMIVDAKPHVEDYPQREEYGLWSKFLAQ